jgi:hypothetical protein
MKPRGLEPSQFNLAVGDTGYRRPCLRPELVLGAVDMAQSGGCKKNPASLPGGVRRKEKNGVAPDSSAATILRSPTRRCKFVPIQKWDVTRRALRTGVRAC